MLLSLLPLAGWAITVNPGTGSLTAGSVEWDNGTHDVFASQVTATSSLGTVTVYYAVVKGNAVPQANAENTWYEYGDAKLKVKDAGTYYGWYKVVSSSSEEDPIAPTNISGSFTITPADITASDFTAPQTKSQEYDATKTGAAARAAITAGSWSNDYGTFYYSTTYNATGVGYTTAIPTAENAGSVNVYWMIKGNNDHNDYNPANAEAAKVVGTITKKNIASGLTVSGIASKIYNGDEQKLSGVSVSFTDAGATRTVNNCVVAYYTNSNRDAAASEVKDKATYYLKITEPAEGSNYSFTESTKTYDITARNLFVEATVTKTYDGVSGLGGIDYDDTDKYFNDDNVVFTFTGWQKDDEASVTPTFDWGTSGSEALTNILSAAEGVTFSKNQGNYALSIDKTKITVNSNYNLVVKSSSNLHIAKKADLAITYTYETNTDGNTNYIQKDYGTNPTLDYLKGRFSIANSVTGDNDAIKAIFTDFTVGSTKNQDGTYDITLTKSEDNAVLAVLDNYTYNADSWVAPAKIKYNNATLYVSLKTSSLSKLTKVYDGQEPSVNLTSADFDVDGWIKNADKVDLNITATLVNPTHSANVGNYTVNFSFTGDAPEGYDVDADGTATYKITAKTIAIANVTIPEQVVVAGNNITKTNFTITGIVSTDNKDAIYELYLDNSVADSEDATKVDASKTSSDSGDNLIKIKVKNATLAANYSDITAAVGKLTILDAGTIKLDADVDMTTELAAANGSTKAVTFASRTLTADSWNVMVLPFEITVSDLSKQLGYAVVDVLDQTASDGNIHFNLFMGTIKANTPFMFKVDGAKTNLNQFSWTPTSEKPIVYNTANNETDGYVKIGEDGNPYVTDGAGNKLIGTYKPTAINDGEYYFGLVDGKPGWKPAASASPIKGERAILVAAGEGARQILIEEPDGSTTAIDVVVAERITTSNTGWYTLNGVKLQGAPTEKGIYINNGKKIVVK